MQNTTNVPADLADTLNGLVTDSGYLDMMAVIDALEDYYHIDFLDAYFTSNGDVHNAARAIYQQAKAWNDAVAARQSRSTPFVTVTAFFSGLIGFVLPLLAAWVVW